MTGVRMTPGATAFTRMPSFAYIVPAERVLFTTPPFEAE